MILAAGWLVAAAGTHAQPAPPGSVASTASHADPLRPDAAVPPMIYTSPLKRYRAARDVGVGSWREANESVTRIGGWRSHAREASQPEPNVSAPASLPVAPGHGKH